jgi:hypothetical protein
MPLPDSQSVTRTTKLFILPDELAKGESGSAKTPRDQDFSHEEPPPKRQKVGEPRAARKVLPAIPNVEPIGMPAAEGHLQAESQHEWYRSEISILSFNNKIRVASSRDSPGTFIRIMSVPKSKEAAAGGWLLQMKHTNVVALGSVFEDELESHFLTEPTYIPLTFVAQCPRQRTSREIGTIVGQVRCSPPPLLCIT